MKSGVELIAEERKRQVEKEGWTPEHDAEHDEGEMVDAAICYAIGDTQIKHEPLMDYPNKITVYQNFWPWHLQYWKPSPKDRVRELTKAGALIAAEIDRLQMNSETADETSVASKAKSGNLS